jgi:hypothetical protein
MNSGARSCSARNIPLYRFDPDACENSKDMTCSNVTAHATPAASTGIQVPLLFLFFHKRLYGPLANSRFHPQADPIHPPESKLEAAVGLCGRTQPITTRQNLRTRR